MERDDWLELNRRGMEGTFRAMAAASGAKVLEPNGVLALVSTAAPERSVFSSVVYRDAEALAAVRDQLAGIYSEHGCAWTVWVPEDDTATARMLERAGHVLDAEPRAMGAEIRGYPEPDMGGIEWTDEGDIDAASLLNDHGYGYEEGTWKRGIGNPEGLRTYLASVDGLPAATVASLILGDDCSIWSVATEPEFRGRGLSTALMRRAAFDAAQAGCATSTLQATQLGRPVYERVGYRDFGALQMWEWRD